MARILCYNMHAMGDMHYAAANYGHNVLVVGYYQLTRYKRAISHIIVDEPLIMHE